MHFTKSKLRVYALLVVIPVAGIGAASLATTTFSTLVAHGPIQQGHSNILCSDCHTAGQGNIRQQLQANLSYALGRRSSAVNFGYQPVTSEQCLACHERPNERHPIYRFNEPRFAQVRQQLKANSCLGCHTEHENARVSVTQTLCSHCHDDLVLKNDPLDVHHDQLIAEDTWDSCMGCHDFHGNHVRQPQTQVSNAFGNDVIKSYLHSGHNPYGNLKLYETKTSD